MFINIKYQIKDIKTKLAHTKNYLCDLSSKFLILTYHRVLPEAVFNPFNTIVSLKTFIKQIDGLAMKYKVTTLEDMKRQCDSGKIKDKIQIIITFDDGYWDNYEFVFPILRKKGLPAAFFIVTNNLESGKPLWDWEIAALLSNVMSLTELRVGSHIFRQKLNEPRVAFVLRIIDYIKSAGLEFQGEVFEMLKQKINVKLIHEYANKCMNRGQVVRLSKEGMEIGAHSLSHRSLARINYLEAIDEISRSKQIIESYTKKPCLHFAFPFGSKNDYNDNLIKYVKIAGYSTCLLNIHGYNYPRKNVFSFKRIIMHETRNIKYLLG